VGDLHEIIDGPTVDRISLLLAIALPPLLCAIGAMVGTRYEAARRGARIGLMVGMLGPVNLVLWRLYNLITDRLGLDSVANVFVNLAVFAIIGLAAGLLIRRMITKSPKTEMPSQQEP
jgi:hypothetical protein